MIFMKSFYQWSKELHSVEVSCYIGVDASLVRDSCLHDASSVLVIARHFLSFSKTLFAISTLLLQSSGLNHSFESGFHYFERGFLLQTKCPLIWLLKEWISTPTPGKNAPQGVENEHYECRIGVESSNRE